MDSHPAMLDTVTLEAVLTDMMSVDRNKEAVHIFFAWKQTRLDYLVTKLAILVLSSPHCEVRAMSAILLRKLVAKNEFHLWPNLPDTTQTTLKSTLLKSIECETVHSVLKNLCDTVAEVARTIFPQYKSELIPFLSNCISSQNPKLQESGLLILAPLLRKMSIKDVRWFCTEIETQQCLSSSADFVRVAAFGAAIKFIKLMPSNNNLEQPFVRLLRSMNRTLANFTSDQEETGQEAIKMLIELAEKKRKPTMMWFWDNMLHSMFKIAESDSFQKGTRHLALEYIFTNTLASMRWGCEKFGFLTTTELLITTVIKVLSDIEEDNLDCHTKEEEHPSGIITYRDGQDIVYRVFSSLRINISNFFSLLPVYLSATEWREKYVVLFVLRELLETHPEMIIDTMDQIVSRVLNSLQDPSSMVRYAVMDVFGQLSMNFGPQLLVQYHHGLMPALISGLDGHPQLQVLAAKLITSILKNCNSDILNSEQFNMIVKNLYEKKEQQTLWDALKSIVASVCGINEIAENGISNLKYNIEEGTGRIIFIKIKFLDEEFGIKEFYYIGNTFYVV